METDRATPLDVDTRGAATRVIDVAEFLNAQPLGAFQVRVALLCAGLLLLDSYDSMALGYIAPLLSRVWHLSPGALGPAFAGGFIGQLLGAVVAGPLADRVGRKVVLLAATVEFACGALLTTQAGSLHTLLLIRLVTGIGIGAALPNAVALCTEYGPSRRRSVLLVLVFCGITIGSICAGMVVTRVVPTFGWTSVFWIGGCAPLAWVPVLVLGLAESPYWLALQGNRDAQLAGILRRLAPGARDWAGVRFVLREERGSGLSVVQLFRQGRATATMLLWIITFMSNMEIYVFASWLPTLARATGLTEQASVLAGVSMTAGGLAGTLSMGWLLDRFTIERVMAAIYTGGAACILLLAAVAGRPAGMLWVAAAAGFCIIGGQTGANALIAYRHPTFIRATALAWALGSGRVASILGPLGTGWIISLGWSPRVTFLLGSLPALCAAVAVAWLGERVWQSGARRRWPTPA